MHTFSFPPRQARFAGVCYLVIILCGVGSEVALRGPLINFASAADTMQAINDNLLRFRMSILTDIVMALADATLALLLFWMLRPISAGLALAALVFRLLQSGLIAASLLNLQGAVLLAQTEGAAGSAQMVLHNVTLHAYGYDLGLIFFGVNCFLMAALMVRSEVIPKSLGVAIGLSGLVYLLGSIARFVAPDAHHFFTPAYALPLVAETAFCLWLLVLPQTRRPAVPA